MVYSQNIWHTHVHTSVKVFSIDSPICGLWPKMRFPVQTPIARFFTRSKFTLPFLSQSLNLRFKVLFFLQQRLINLNLKIVI